MLVLGGSTEATALAARLAGMAGIDATLSLAGRTAEPPPQALPVRVGGFGGAEGLAAHLRAEGVGLLVDATHPFAARMSANARDAAASAGVPLLRVSRPGWVPRPGDRWREVATMADAAAALGEEPMDVFLTVGRLQLAAFAAAPQHRYLVRSIEPVAPGHGLPRARFITARGPFTVEDEMATMREHAVDVLVTKNSGGAASAAKIEAARRLGIAMLMVGRPEADDGALDVEAAMAVIRAHAGALRGV